MRNYVYMILAAVCLGTIGVLVKLIGTEIHFMTLNFFRLFFGFLFLLLTVPFIDKNAFKITRKDIKGYFVTGSLLAISLSLYVTGMVFAPVQNVVLISYIYPFFVLIFAYFLLKERITKTKIITLIIAITGLSVINPFESGANYLGSMLAMAGAVFYALLVTEMRKEDRMHSIGDVLWFLFFATLLLSPFPFVFGTGNLSGVLVYLLALGFVSTGLAYLLFNLALEKIGAEIGSIIETIITPLVAIPLAVLVIYETIDIRIIIGGAIL
jgi:drug/metabolite transporter (DMT)-like permease